MATAAARNGAQDVRTILSYAGDMVGRPRLDVVDPERNNLVLEPHDVLIRDARGLEDAYSLERNGFAFVRHSSSVSGKSAFFEEANAQQIQPTGLLKRYSDEMIDFLRDHVGAAHMIPQVGSFIARTSRRARKKTWAGTANMVHLDYTTEAAALFLKWNAETADQPLPPHQHFAFIQTWRAVSRGPQDNTLAICDGASVPVEDGVETDAVMGPADVPGKCFPFRLCRHRSDHKWYYLSDMERDDVLLFKGFDSREPLSMNAMHTAFDNPLADEDSEPRRSVEARFIAFFD